MKNFYLCKCYNDLNDIQEAIDKLNNKFYSTDPDTITKVITHNDRVVILRFGDGTFTKAVCSPNDKFDLDVGIQVCMLKKILGESEYHKTMRDIHKMIDQQELEKKNLIDEKRERRELQKIREEKNRLKEKKAHDIWINDLAKAVCNGILKTKENGKVKCNECRNENRRTDSDSNS